MVMRTASSDVPSRSLRGRGLDARLRRARKARLRRSVLEGLESRTLLAVLPPAQILGQPVNISNAGGNETSPAVAIDRYAPEKLVAVWVRNDPNLPDNNETIVAGAYSNDGGASWLSFNATIPVLLDPTSTADPPATYSIITNPSVGFDAGGNVYVLVQQTNADNSSGALVLTRFDFTGNAPIPTLTNVVRQYVQDPVFNVTMTVDDNVASFTDPATGVVQRGLLDRNGNPYAGNIWIAWSTNETPPDGVDPAIWNPNSIQVISSSDRGASFTSPLVVNDAGRFGPQRLATPKIAVSQGTATIPGGQATVIWDDFGTFADVSAPALPFDLIQSSRITNGGTAVIVNGAGGVIDEDVKEFAVTVNLADPKFISLTNLTVTVNLLQATLADVQIELVAPDNTRRLLLPAGVTGTNLGIAPNGQPLGTVFDSRAARSILDGGATAPFVGTFRPLQSLGIFNGRTPAGLNGTWRLVITDSTGASDDQLLGFSLNFTSGLSDTPDSLVAFTFVTGSQSGVYPRASAAAGSDGIGPGIQIAADNTLGSFSPHQGRLYVTYVGYDFLRNGPRFDIDNPADNTDIYLVGSDDGGVTWFPLATSQPRGRVNTDLAVVDGYTGAQPFPSSNTLASGRPQFQPAIAVDQATGTVVMSWRDARDDAARSRSAVYVTASIDGGESFNAQIFANPAKTATDAITLETVVLSPQPDNLSGLDPAASGFGSQMGLAVHGGKVYPLWPANFNRGFISGGAVQGTPLDIYLRPLGIAGGPRIVDSTMGPVPGPQPGSFTVTFDRLIDPSSFTVADVRVFYRDTTNGNPFIPLRVTGVAPLDGMTFEVNFNPTQRPDGTPSGITNFTGTYSYVVAPTITDTIRSANRDGSLRLGGNPMDQNADGTPGQNPLATPFTGLTPGDAYAAPMPKPLVPTLFDSALSILRPPFDTLTLPLIVSGPYVVSTAVAGGSGADNLVLNGTNSAIDVTFDRPMDPSTFTAADVLAIVGPVGPLAGPFTVSPLSATTFRIGFPTQTLSGTYTIELGPDIRDTLGQPLDTNRNAGLDVLRGEGPNAPTEAVSFTASGLPQPIPEPSFPGSPGQLASTITVTDDFTIQGVTTSGRTGIRVRLNISHPFVPDLTAILVYNLGQMGERRAVLFSGVGNGPSTANFNNTLFDDGAFTPVQQGAAPFFLGPFNPQESLLTAFQGLRTAGTWTLLIEDSRGNGLTGVLNHWSLTFEKPLPTSGLGELTADRASASFRIFTMDPANPQSRNTWTPVGPAPITGRTSRVGGLAVDPSDPSGNTVYVGGATGGIWKTTNFLTTAPGGPTYVPLTDFGPTNAINIGGIAVFGRNSDTNQSVVVVATGEGDTGLPGVGFLISKDGGATWDLYDSTRNVDASGNLLPINSSGRDRVFVGSTAFKVEVDPRLTPDGEVIIYAALSGRNGGIWRSVDTGKTWQLMRSGQATDLVLDPASGTGAPGGNLQVLYGAFRGEGVFLSPNRGQIWSLMAGGVGNPLIFNESFQNVNPAASDTPNGANGRIVLGKPALTGNIVQDQIYRGWLYAAVAAPDGSLDGVFLTKDFGQNWTQVRIPSPAPLPGTVGPFRQAIPTNDVGIPDFNVLGFQGNYDIALAVDPTNPNVIYLGGQLSFGASGLVRIDTTRIWDAHALVPYANDAPAGGLDLNSTGPVRVIDNQLSAPTPYLNFIRNPGAPFLAGSSLFVFNVDQFTNNGAGVRWTPFDIGGTDQHRFVTIVDPVTRLPRLIAGDDQGVWSVLDNNGSFFSGIGTAAVPGRERNGNLQTTQFYYGTAQPSRVAAQIAGALFYGSAQDNGGPFSDPNVLDNGNLLWTGPGGDATGVATDQQGNGTVYQYFWPCCGGDLLEFFQVNYNGRTFGLLQQSGGLPTPDPQWPFVGGANFAVNPLNGNQIVISSSTGRIFSTETQGITWFEIGAPEVFGNPGTFSVALAYGAPDPAAPGGIGTLGNFIYVGTGTGRIFVTQTGGGGSGNNWIEISSGLSGGAVRSIVTNPNRGSHEAFAVTDGGVFYIADSIPSASNPTPTWVNITSNLRSLSYEIFGETYNPTTDPNAIRHTQAATFAAIAADWRYAIPTNPANPTSPVHPVLYVAGNSGVFRSLDRGATWSRFPNISLDGAPIDGGYLPNASVTDLDLSLGNIDVATGRPDLAGPYDPFNPSAADPNLLLATTYGRGSWAIRLAPLILPTTVRIRPQDVNGTAADGTPLVTTATPTLLGLSAISGFKNATRITIRDITNPASPRIIGGFNPANVPGTNVPANWTDSFGNFAIRTLSGLDGFTSNGRKTVEIYATDDAGTIGNVVTLSFTIEADDLPPLPPTTPPIPPTLTMRPADDTGTPGDGITRIPNPRFDGVTSINVPVELLLFDSATQTYVPFSPPATTTSSAVNGAFTLQFPNPPGPGGSFLFPDGTYTVIARATNVVGSSDSNPVTFTIKSQGPTQAPTLQLRPQDDSGIVGDNITNIRKPRFTGTIGPANGGSLIQLFRPEAPNTVLASAIADANGDYTIPLPFFLVSGTTSLFVRAVDAAGNPAPAPSPTLTLTIVTVALDYSGNLADYVTNAQPAPPPPPNPPQPAQSEAALFRRDASGKGLWFVQPASPSSVPTWFPPGTNLGAANDVPMQGDFDGDGRMDLVVYDLDSAIWILIGSTRGYTAFQLGTPNSSLPVAGNFEGPGTTQFGVFEIVNNVGRWTLTSALGGLQTIDFGLPGDIPVPGDYDGIGRDQLAVYRPSTAEFLVRAPSGLVRSITIGTPNLVPVPAQYDNHYYFANGLPYRTQAAVYDPSTGVFTIAGATGIRTVAFQPGDIPIPADYAGNGSDQPAVFRPGTVQFIRKDNGGNDLVFGTFGLATDIPIGAPLSYRLPASASQVTPPDEQTVTPPPSGGAAPPPVLPPPPSGGSAPPPVLPPPPAGGTAPPPAGDASPPPAPTAVPTTLQIAQGNGVVVSGTLYANGRRPWFVGTTEPGARVDFVLTGSQIIGAQNLGSVTADGNGNFAFQLPAGYRNGSYVLVAHGQSSGSQTSSSPVSFRIGPVPRTPPRRGRGPVRPRGGAPRIAVRVQKPAVQQPPPTTSVVDLALEAFVEDPLAPTKKA